MPNYVITASDDAVVLRNYEGMLVRYQAEDKTPTVQPTTSRGVSSLLQGERTALVPENSERMARRQRHRLTSSSEQSHPEQDAPHEHAGHGNGCCGESNGHDSRAVLLSLDVLPTGCGS
jgi:lysine 2,3-aminomutase